MGPSQLSVNKGKMEKKLDLKSISFLSIHQFSFFKLQNQLSSIQHYISFLQQRRVTVVQENLLTSPTIELKSLLTTTK